VLLIFSNRADFTVDYVICRLLERGLPYFRINSEEISTAFYELEYRERTVSQHIAIAERELFIEDVTSVWYRRKPTPQVSSIVPLNDRNFAFGELTHVIEGLSPDSSILWVDYPSAVHFAERKLQQLRAAIKLGLPIPDTLVSTNPNKLQDFVMSHPQGVICKPIFRGLNIIGDDAESAFTRIIDVEEISKLSNDWTFPTLVQGAIPKGSDLRITVVGDKLFSVEITTKEKRIDWRLPDANPTYSPYSLSMRVKDQCLNMLKYFGLCYGAFDFAVSPNGDIYFLEVNAVGEWAWLDRKLELGIREALINLLYGTDD
jgi:glutathione synthase/RimK-type ligase-like ATP-grasp enzyme